MSKVVNMPTVDNLLCWFRNAHMCIEGASYHEYIDTRYADAMYISIAAT